MKQIQTFPPSLQAEFQSTSSLAQSGGSNYEVFTNQAADSLIVVAQRNPELATVLLGTLQGYRGVEFTTTEHNEYTHLKSSTKMFGLEIESSTTPTLERRTTTRTVRFVK